jgi:hypothetical protein
MDRACNKYEEQRVCTEYWSGNVLEDGSLADEERNGRIA